MAGVETEGWGKILHRQDERGVVVESRSFGPDDEIPEGFGVVEYQPVHEPRTDDPVLADGPAPTPWETPVAKGGWVENRYEDAEVDEGTPVQARFDDELTDAEREAAEEAESDEGDGDDSEPETDEGSPREAREQSDGELTEAEEEVDEALESDEDDDAGEGSDEVDEGTPVQAREQSGEGEQPPPKGGPGSGVEAWAGYASVQGVTVDPGAGRDDIIAALKKAGKPVD